MRLFEKGQGATEYLLMLAAVLVIVAIAVYYVMSTGGFPAVGASAAKYGDNEIRINVLSGSIPAGDWQYRITGDTSSPVPDWTEKNVELKASHVSLGTYQADTYYVSLRHKPSGHVYFEDQRITIS